MVPIGRTFSEDHSCQKQCYMYIFNTSEDMSQVKVFVIERRADKPRRTDEWVLMPPPLKFRKSAGTK